MHENLLRLPQVSDLTGVPVATLRHWRHHGIGPRSAKIGARVVYRESEVLAWIDAQFDPAQSDSVSGGSGRIGR